MELSTDESGDVCCSEPINLKRSMGLSTDVVCYLECRKCNELVYGLLADEAEILSIVWNGESKKWFMELKTDKIGILLSIVWNAETIKMVCGAFNWGRVKKERFNSCIILTAKICSKLNCPIIKISMSSHGRLILLKKFLPV